MAEAVQTGLVRAVQVAGEVEVRRSANGLRFATFGETGVPAPDLDSMIEAVPPSITAALGANTYFFVPLALREPDAVTSTTQQAAANPAEPTPDQPAMVAEAYSAEFDERAICHRNVSLGTGQQGVFISTRLMGDRFALCFEFFINIAHAFADATGVPPKFAELAWQQAQTSVRGETSMDAWEARNLAQGRPAQAEPEPPARDISRDPARRSRTFAISAAAASPTAGVIDEKERTNFLAAAFSDSLAMYLLSLAVDFDYSELREREYPLLAPAALAARLRIIAELFPPNPGYEFAIRYRRRA